MIRLLAALLVACCAFAQDSALERLKQELKVAQGQEISDDQKARDQKDKTGVWPDEEKGRRAARIARVHSALLAWIESQLPKGPSASAIKSSDWESAIHKQFAAAGIAERETLASAGPDPPDIIEEPGFGYASVSLDWKSELPEMLFITASVGVRCGEDQAVYGYRFDSNGWARVISDHPESDWGTWAASPFKLSDADYLGRRLLLVCRLSVQCASFWMTTTYTVFQVSRDSTARIFSGDHSFWLGEDEDDGMIFVLKPDELILELSDTGLDTERRVHVMRYKFSDGVKRLDPIAIRPQDFVEEWLTGPWSEMQSRSAADMQKWHSKLHKESVLGEYLDVVPCSEKPDRWSIGIEITYSDGKRRPAPIDLYFLVRELGNYRFQMEAVSDSPLKECPGEGEASGDHPWLSREQLKALP